MGDKLNGGVRGILRDRLKFHGAMIKQGGYLLSGEVDQKCADMMTDKLREQRLNLKEQERQLKAKHQRLEQQLRQTLAERDPERSGFANLTAASVQQAVSQLKRERNELHEQMQV